MMMSHRHRLLQRRTMIPGLQDFTVGTLRIYRMADRGVMQPRLRRGGAGKRKSFRERRETNDTRYGYFAYHKVDLAEQDPRMAHLRLLAQLLVRSRLPFLAQEVSEDLLPPQQPMLVLLKCRVIRECCNIKPAIFQNFIVYLIFALNNTGNRFMVVRNCTIIVHSTMLRALALFFSYKGETKYL
jgi:hypothetical protein